MPQKHFIRHNSSPEPRPFIHLVLYSPAVSNCDRPQYIGINLANNAVNRVYWRLFVNISSSKLWLLQATLPLKFQRYITIGFIASNKSEIVKIKLPSGGKRNLLPHPLDALPHLSPSLVRRKVCKISHFRHLFGFLPPHKRILQPRCSHTQILVPLEPWLYDHGETNSSNLQKVIILISLFRQCFNLSARLKCSDFEVNLGNSMSKGGHL